MAFSVRKSVTLARPNLRYIFNLSKQQLEIQNLSRDFAEKELRPIAAYLDETKTFPVAQLQKLSKLGLTSITISQKYGGLEKDHLTLALAIEEISRVCAGTGITLSVHNCLYVNTIEKYLNRNLFDQFLIPFTQGQIGCFALSEANAGSDAAALTTTARLENDSYVLNGRKKWVTNGKYASAAIVFATRDTNLKHEGICAFVVPIPTDGLEIGPEENKLGIRASSTCDLILKNVKVPKENMLKGSGFKLAMRQFDGARIGIAAQALGIGQAALECAIDYANKRQCFGATIIQNQAVQMKISEMATKLEGARLLTWRAAMARDTQKRCTKESSMAKLAASEAANFAADQTVQILGGMGYVSDFPAERHFRDARVTQLYAGVTDIQKFVISRLVAKELKNK